jgi:hypothetical protein
MLVCIGRIDAHVGPGRRDKGWLGLCAYDRWCIGHFGENE